MTISDANFGKQLRTKRKGVPILRPKEKRQPKNEQRA
jgi:hypothetical protein